MLCWKLNFSVQLFVYWDSTAPTSAVTVVVLPVGKNTLVFLIEDSNYSLLVNNHSSFLQGHDWNPFKQKRFCLFSDEENQLTVLLWDKMTCSRDNAESMQTAELNLEPAQVWECWKILAFNSCMCCQELFQVDKCWGSWMKLKHDFTLCLHKQFCPSHLSPASAPKHLMGNRSNVRWTLRVTVALLPIGTAGLLATQVKLRPLSVSAGVMGR